MMRAYHRQIIRSGNFLTTDSAIHRQSNLEYLWWFPEFGSSLLTQQKQICFIAHQQCELWMKNKIFEHFNRIWTHLLSSQNASRQAATQTTIHYSTLWDHFRTKYLRTVIVRFHFRIVPLIVGPSPFGQRHYTRLHSHRWIHFRSAVQRYHSRWWALHSHHFHLSQSNGQFDQIQSLFWCWRR